jgi:hypothetical protein
VNSEEIAKLTRFLQAKFQLPALQVKKRPQKTDSCEVFIGEEFIGIIYRDDEDDDDLSWSFQMAILEFDLEDTEQV